MAASHFAVFPMLQQGHMIPMIDIARLLARQGAVVTIFTTPVNALRFQTILEFDVQTRGSDIRVVELEFRSEELGFPQGCENADMLPSLASVGSFVLSTRTLHVQAERAFRDLRPKPTCVLSDVIFPWTVDISKKYGIPRIVFHGISCFALLCSHNLVKHKVIDQLNSDTDQLVVPDVPDEIVFSKHQLPINIRPGSSEMKEYQSQRNAAEEESFGIVVNSLEALEPEYAKRYKEAKSPQKIWFVGPVCLCSKDDEDKAERGDKSCIDRDVCLRWLDGREPGSVIYACLGSLCPFDVAQMIELGLGLEVSERPFVWVIRKREGLEELEKWVKESGFEERTKDRGLVIWGWAPQVFILSHRGLGGFLTHCGWNSTLEGVCAGLPLITWPMFSDQFYNQKLVTQIWRVGVEVGVESPLTFEGKKTRKLVTKEKIAKAIKTLMDDGEEGQERKRRVREMAKIASKAYEEGGLSHINMECLINDIIQQVGMQSTTSDQGPSCSLGEIGMR